MNISLYLKFQGSIFFVSAKEIIQYFTFLPHKYSLWDTHNTKYYV